ncbi:hypothetical protein PF001_g27517 [Phytophthora fragariae]|nr:hypothetical protein PF001_g27517 [Phytophthora fragariae]KAE9283117.1 hypothetical protein PF008_g27479 [Phytophthora fragariae]
MKTSTAVCKPVFDDEGPLYLSGEETGCDSERGSDTLSREDQQLMDSFILLQREAALPQGGAPPGRRRRRAHLARADSHADAVPVGRGDRLRLGARQRRREDQQLMVSFILLQRERAHKHIFNKEASRPDVAAAAHLVRADSHVEAQVRRHFHQAVTTG